ncbi:MAG: DUF4380 domain-containing protein [Planctomycetes bacterium]|nr:DUF4380 domain-containing protein [Planctomycetota bacterium]
MANTNMESHLVILQNESVTVGALPQVGGRVALLRRTDGENILKAVPEKWDTAAFPPPCPSPSTITPDDFVPYYGHTIWVGPQAAWWQRQSLNTKLRNKHSQWPPDPCLTFSPYEVTEQTASRIVMQGPASEITGLQISKTVELLDDGRVRHRAEAVNRRDEPVAWDLWSNTRMDGTCRAYVPVTPDDYCRYNFADTDIANRRDMPFRIVDGFYTLDPDASLFKDGVTTLGAKAFLPCAAGWMAGFTETDLFIKKSTPVPFKDIHPKQAFAEIYQRLDTNPADTILELEMHGKYCHLKPGESMSFEETWELAPYSGANTAEAHVKFLRERYE